MRVLFVVNLPSPYRVDFFNELGKYLDLTVAYERSSAADRDIKWKGDAATGFREIYLNLKPLNADQSLGTDVIRVIKQEDYDYIFLANYASPSILLAIIYCRLRKIPYILEHDGGLNKKDPPAKLFLKWILLKGAWKHFTTSDEHISYLLSMKIKDENIIKYPFTSSWNREILKTPVPREEKRVLRTQLKIPYEKVVVSVGQFRDRKGHDVILKGAAKLDPRIGFYIIGGSPRKEYLELKDKYDLHNVHFLEFINKEDLNMWYKASDLFALMTRTDVWGLVVNEAMAHGLPVITTDKCAAGNELVRSGDNGFIVPVDDEAALADRIMYILADEDRRNKMQISALNSIKNHSIENMAAVHFDWLKLFERR